MKFATNNNFTTTEKSLWFKLREKFLDLPATSANLWTRGSCSWLDSRHQAHSTVNMPSAQQK